MAKCMACEKNILLTKKFGNTVICGNCAKLINLSSWNDRFFSSMDELVAKKQIIIELAKSNQIKKEILNSIIKYFDEYIEAGFITSINGKTGQTLNVFSEYCIIHTKSESAKDSLENTFCEFDDNDDDDYDDDELFSANDKRSLVQGLMSGKLIQTGIGVAVSATLQKQEKEKEAEKRSRQKYDERRKNVEKLIKVGDKKIYLKNINLVETFSTSSTSNGYLKFVPIGVSKDDLYACEYFFFNNSIPFETKKIKQKIEYISNTLNEKINILKQQSLKNLEEKQLILEKEKQQVSINNIDIFQEIRKYKQLLDEGILTEEEFNKKKKELLNL